MPTPIQILLDPVSLMVMAMYIGLMVWEALFPARQLPYVKFWKLKGLTAFALFFYLSSYLPLITDPFLEPYRLFDLTELGTLGGALVTADPDLYERLHFLHKTLGPVAGAFDAYLVLRGVRTLAVRMERHCDNAEVVAAFLAGDPRVEWVLFPGLPDHPGHDVAVGQMSRFGGMVSFLPKGGVDAAGRIAAATSVFTLAVSLGGVESLIEVPAPMTHASTAGSEFEPPADLIRLSVGLEHADDLIADLDRALG